MAFWRNLVLAIAIAGACVSASAQQAGRRVALVIGNSAYASQGTLANPGPDSRLVADALRRVGFTVTARNDLGKQAMELALRDFARAADGAEVALIYYAGHGMEANGVNWLLPVDAVLAEERNLRFEAIDLETTFAAVEGAKGLRMVVLDACRNNPFARSMRRSATTRATVTRGLADVEVTGTLVLYAARGGTVAQDGPSGGNSPFAEAFARRLPEPGVDIRLLVSKVRDDVLTATNRGQEPFSYGSLPGVEMALVEAVGGSRPAPDPDAGRRLQEAQRRIEALEKVERDVSGGGRASGDQIKDCDVCPAMVFVGGGVLPAGNHIGQHVGQYLMGVFEVTFTEWDACVAAGGCNGYRPSDNGWGRGNRPVMNVSWEDAKAYTSWLSARTGKSYRLPTNNEWENAARAGRTTVYWWGNTISVAQANYDSNYNARTTEAGKFFPNPNGLYDVHGNVWEWVEDCANAACTSRAIRGGSWNYIPSHLSLDAQGFGGQTDRFNYVGFRVLRQ